MTGNFMEFKIENQVRQSWNEQSAMTSTAVCLSCILHYDGSFLASELCQKGNLQISLVLSYSRIF